MSSPAPETFLAKTTAWFLVATIMLGLLLRWEFVTGFLSARGFSFADVRHAHSHAGYYGVLVLPTLWALRNNGLLLPKLLLQAYAACAALASLLFAFMGYAWPTIVLSTLILGMWCYVIVAWWRRHGLSHGTWFDVVPWGIVLGGVAVPAIAVSAGRNPALSTQIAHFFLSLLLLGVFVPSALGLFAVRRQVPLAGAIAAVVAGAAAVVFPRELGPLALPFLVLLAWVYVAAIAGSKLPAVLKLDWLLLVLFLPLGALPFGDSNDLRIAGIHFTILGPVILSYFLGAMPGGVVPNGWWFVLYHAALGAMLLAIAAGPLVFPESASLVTALASTAYVMVVSGTVGWYLWRFRLRGS